FTGFQRKRAAARPPAFLCSSPRLAPSRVAHVLVVLVEALFHLALGVIAFPAVSFLQRTGELVHRAVDAVEIVVGELAPPLLDLTAHLLPLAGENVLVHEIASFSSFTSSNESVGSKTCAFAQIAVAGESRKSYSVNLAGRRPRPAYVAVVAAVRGLSAIGIAAAHRGRMSTHTKGRRTICYRPF